MTVTFFATQALFRTWLKKNHKKEKELLVGFYKVNSGKPSITWPESVDQALCFGWIDGIRRSIDKESYCIRFTPRNPKSTWSTININKVKELQNAGLMTTEGQKAFELRKQTNSGIYSHENETAVLAADFEKLFKKEKAAWLFFNTQAPSYKKLITHWIMSAKQEKTRLARLEKTIKISGQQKRIL
ncbi:MAG: YdeI/OmpD-associated family protein [Ferruginibacter sp.]